MLNKNFYQTFNLNILWKALNKAVPYILIIYFLCFRSYFLSQQFLLQENNFVNSSALASYFNISKVSKNAIIAFSKASNHDDSQNKSFKKRAVLSFGVDFKFLYFEVFFGLILFFIFAFFVIKNKAISFLSFFYRNRAPPLFC